METNCTSTAAAYIRVSTEDQVEFSPDSQLKRIREYAEHRRIWIPEKYIFLDEGISGRSADNRPSFLSMIREAQKKPRPFDQILVWKFSRFARNRQDSIFYKSMLRRECGIDVVSVTEQLSDDPTSILIEALLEAMDEYYSVNLAQEVRRGMNEKFSRGGVVSPPPFGYRMNAGHCEPDVKTSRFIPMIFSDYLQGMSCRRIAEKLNRMGVRTIRGCAFEARTVQYILGNPFYLGMQRRHLSVPPDDEPMTVVPAFHAPLISEEIFFSAQKQLLLSRRGRTSRSTSPHASFMLCGLVRCSFCGATLTQARKGQTLQCCRYTRGQCPESHSISLGKLNKAVIQKIKEDLSSVPGQKKGRKFLPALSKSVFFSEIPELLNNPLLTEDLKNEILRTLVCKITFFRKEDAIRIHYRF